MVGNIDSVRKSFFLVHINYLNMAAVDSYFYIFTKGNIYTVAGLDFGEWGFQILICVRFLYLLMTSIDRWNEALS